MITIAIAIVVAALFCNMLANRRAKQQIQAQRELEYRRLKLEHPQAYEELQAQDRAFKGTMRCFWLAVAALVALGIWMACSVHAP